MKTPIKCKKVDEYVDPECKDASKCTKTVPECPKVLTKEDIQQFVTKIGDDYEAQLIIDNLPVANLQSQYFCGSLGSNNDKNVYTAPDGFPIGCKDSKDKNSFYVNNHLTFKLKFHQNEQTKKFSVVGASVIPSSLEHTEKSCSDGFLKDLKKLKLSVNLKSIQWTYSVEWEPSETRWASRWDAYLTIGNQEDYKVHWFSIVNSLMIVFFLTGMVAMIMLRALHKDIALYNEDNPS